MLVGLQNSASSKNVFFFLNFPKKNFPPWSEMTLVARGEGAEESEFLVNQYGGRGSSGAQHEDE